MTFNPVWGCLNHCEYCYARGIAKRFKRKMAKLEYKNYICDVGEDGYDVMRWIDGLKERLKFFRPTFLKSQFNKKFPRKPQRIFVGSMSEIFYWKDEWMEMVIEKVKQYPQHTFIFLTKFPRVYSKYNFPDNCWLGVTIIKNLKDGENNRWDYYQFKQDNPNNLKFYCFEPLLRDMELQHYLHLEGINWVIIGAETGNRKDKIIPRGEWIENILYECKIHKTPVYLKDSLKKIYPVEIKEFPEVK